jgi:trehalose 6-phosphate synthase/phosphatase
VQHLLSRRPPPALIVAFGDDRTDEEMFAALPPTGISLHVGSGASLATRRLRNPQAVRRFLAALLDETPAPSKEAVPVQRGPARARHDN